MSQWQGKQRKGTKISEPTASLLHAVNTRDMDIEANAPKASFACRHRHAEASDSDSKWSRGVKHTARGMIL